MIFEGSEKKLELVVREPVDLLAWPESRWLELIEAAGTRALSKIENSAACAYLLSESSLFIWRDRFTMITCGTTTLDEAALKACKYLREDEIAALFYERKNEYFPQMQKTDFFSDARKLNRVIAGCGYRLGHADEHHLFLFHSCREFQPRKTDATLEILMYGLRGRAREVFNEPNQTAEWIRTQTGLAKLFSGYKVDDHAFSPIGYSLNALNGARYYTVHVTPQNESPYVSFETNVNSRRDIESTIKSVLEVFQPRSFDVVYFDAVAERETVNVNGYVLRGAVREKLSCGFNVHYSHHSEVNAVEAPAWALQLEQSAEVEASRE